MYTKVYCIFAHKNPLQLNDLISMLDDEKSLFFIHLDRKVNQVKYKMILHNSNCHFVKSRIACSWGKYSLVQATLNTMKEVQDYMNANLKNSDYHFIMLSGEDLPLKMNCYIHDFLESNIQTSLINYWKLPYDKWWNGGFFRFESFYFFDYKKNNKLNFRINRIIKKIHLKFLFPLNRFRKYFSSFHIYGASQWMVLSKDLVSFVLEKNDNNPKFNSIFKYVLAPDELYFATLILNYDLDQQFVINNIPTHLVCFEGLEASPKYLDVQDLEYNKSANLLFARKFDPDINQKTIDFAYKMISK